MVVQMLRCAQDDSQDTAHGGSLLSNCLVDPLDDLQEPPQVSLLEQEPAPRHKYYPLMLQYLCQFESDM